MMLFEEFACAHNQVDLSSKLDCFTVSLDVIVIHVLGNRSIHREIPRLVESMLAAYGAVIDIIIQQCYSPGVFVHFVTVCVLIRGYLSLIYLSSEKKWRYR